MKPCPECDIPIPNRATTCDACTPEALTPKESGWKQRSRERRENAARTRKAARSKLPKSVKVTKLPRDRSKRKRQPLGKPLTVKGGPWHVLVFNGRKWRPWRTFLSYQYARGVKKNALNAGYKPGAVKISKSIPKP